MKKISLHEAHALLTEKFEDEARLAKEKAWKKIEDSFPKKAIKPVNPFDLYDEIVKDWPAEKLNAAYGLYYLHNCLAFVGIHTATLNPHTLQNPSLNDLYDSISRVASVFVDELSTELINDKSYMELILFKDSPLWPIYKIYQQYGPQDIS